MPKARNTWIKDYFTFTKKERRAVILLAIIAILFSLLPTMFPLLVKDEVDFIVDEEAEHQLALMSSKDKRSVETNDENNQTEWYQPKQTNYAYSKIENAGTLFYFNPNTATAEEWKQLGVKEKTVQTILKYRSKGGKFRKAEDISRIYGLSGKDVERLLPYVRIEQEMTNSKVELLKTPQSSSAPSPITAGYVFKESKSKPIDINSADTAEWRSLKGIGPFYARRIVGFREKLGGFYSIEQVAETYGLPDSTFQNIKPFLFLNKAAIKQINVNTATADELKAHPYIKGATANAIINYRTNHGQFNTLEQLQNIGAIDEQLYQKIAPYLTIK